MMCKRRKFKVYIGMSTVTVFKRMRADNLAKPYRVGAENVEFKNWLGKKGFEK